MPQSPVTDTAALPWASLGPGVSLKLLRGAPGERVRVLLLRVEPGTVVPLHRHEGEVHAYTLAGHRRLQTGELVGPGGYVHEPAGNVDTWSAVGDEPLVLHVVVEGALEYLGPDGEVVARSDNRSVSEAWARALAGCRPAAPGREIAA